MAVLPLLNKHDVVLQMPWANSYKQSRWMTSYAYAHGFTKFAHGDIISTVTLIDAITKIPSALITMLITLQLSKHRLW